MFHEDFDRSTHNSFFSVSNKQPSLAQRHRDRLPPIQTQLDAAFNTFPAQRQVYPGLGSPPFDATHPRIAPIHPPPIVSPTGRSGSISPESYFAAPVIEHIQRKRARQAAAQAAMASSSMQPSATLAQLAGLVDTHNSETGKGKLAVPVGLGPVKTNTSSAVGAVGSSGVGVVSEEERERERRRREKRREKKEGKEKERGHHEHKSSKEKEKEGKKEKEHQHKSSKEKEGKERSKEGKEREKERSREHKSKKDTKDASKKDKEKKHQHRHRSKSREPSSSKHKDKEKEKGKARDVPSSFQSLEDQYPDPQHNGPDPHAVIPPGKPSGPLHPSLNPHSPHAPHQRYSPNHLGLGDHSFNPAHLATSTPIDALHPLGGGYSDDEEDSEQDDPHHDRSTTPTPHEHDDTAFPHSSDIGDGLTSLGTGLYPPRLEDGSAFPTSQENARLLRNLAPDFPPEVPTPRSNLFRFGAPLTDSPRAMGPGGRGEAGEGGGGKGEEGGGGRPNNARQTSLPEYSALDPYATFGEGGQGSGSTYGEGYGVGVGLTPPSPLGYTGGGLGGQNGFLSAGQEKARLSRIREGSYEGEDTRDVDESTSTSSYGNPDYPQTLGGRSEFDERASVLSAGSGVNCGGGSGGGAGERELGQGQGQHRREAADGEETVSLIGSNASDLRPGGRIPKARVDTVTDGGDEVDVDGGGMVNPKRGLGGGEGGAGAGGIPRSAVSGVGIAHAFSPSSPASVAGPNASSVDLNAHGKPPDPTTTTTTNNNHNNNVNDSSINGNTAKDPTSRKSALMRLDPSMLVNFVLRAEADYDALSQLYTQALAESAIASHTASLSLSKLEKKLKEEEERNKGLREALEKREKDVRTRDGVVVGLERRVREGEREVRRVRERVGEVEKERDELGERVERERERRRAEEARRREVEESLVPLQTQLADLQTTLAKTKVEAQRRIEQLEEQKVEVEKRLNEELARERQRAAAVEKELTVLRLEHANVKNDLDRARVVVAGLEERLRETQEELGETKRKARKMRAEAVALVAKEEGRREGWEEGMRRGRGMVEALAAGVGLGQPRLVGPGDGMAYIEEVTSPDDEDEDRRRRKKEKEREKKKERERQKERERELKEREQRAREAALSEADASHAREMSGLLARLAELESAVANERSKTMELTRQREMARSEVGSVVGRVYELEGRLEKEKAERERERERLEQQMVVEREREREREERERERREREVERERERVREEERQRAKEQISRVEEEKEEVERKRRQRERELEEEEERLRRRRREIEEEDEKRRKEIEEDVKRGKMKEEEAEELRKALEKEKEEKLKLEKELKEAKTPQVTLSYLPMPQPPIASTSQQPHIPMPVPGVASSTGSSTWRGRRRAGTDSGSESDLGTLDILNLPNFGDHGVVSAREGRRRDREKQKQRDLSTIREVASFTSGASPSPHMGGQVPPPPIWVSQPPPNLANGYPVSGGSSYNPAGGPLQMPRPEDYLSPHAAHGGHERPSLRKMGSGSSGSTYDIKVVPPSRPDSSNHNRDGQYQYPAAPGPYKSPYLSPNSAQQPLPHPPRVPGPYDRPPSAGPTQPNSPYSVPGGLPVGFVPQSLTPAPSGVGMPTPVVNGENLDERRKHRRESVMGGSSMRPDAGMNMPRPESSMRSDAGFGMPTPSAHTYGSQTPASTLGRRTPAAGSGIGMPEPSVPNIVRPPTRSSAGTRTPATSGIGMPEPTIPNIVRPPTRGTTAGSRTPATSTIGMPEPTVPLIVPPPGSATGMTPAGGSTMTMPEPTVPNIVGRTPSGGSAITMPEPTVPNIVPSPSGSAPQTLRKKGKKERGSKRNGGMSMPEPTVPSFAPTSPAPGGRPIPDPEIVALMGGHHVTPPPEFTPVIPPGISLDMPGGLNSPMTMPQPTVVDYTGAAMSSGRQSAAPLPVLPSSLRDQGGPGMPTPTVMGMPLASPVIPGVTTPIGNGGMGVTETGEPPFIPPADVMARAASPARSASGGGGSGGVFGGIGNMFGSSPWAGWGGSSGSRNGGGDDDEEAGGKFTGGFIPPGVNTAGDDDDEDMDSQTARNTRMNAEMSRGGVSMPEPEVPGKKTKKKKKR